MLSLLILEFKQKIVSLNANDIFVKSKDIFGHQLVWRNKS